MAAPRPAGPTSHRCFLTLFRRVPRARIKLSVEKFLTQRRRDAEVLLGGGVTAAGRGKRLLARGRADARPSRCSAMNPETILPHSGRRLVGTLALHCPSRRLAGTLALPIMSIMLIMSKTNRAHVPHPFARHAVAGEDARAPDSHHAPFHQKRMIFALPCH